MSDCPDCGDTGFTLTMEPCTHRVHTFRPSMEALEASMKAPVPSVYDYDDDTAPAVPSVGGKVATPKQVEFLRRLIAERDATNGTVIAAAVALSDLMTAKRASDLITALLAIPKTKTTVRPNSYDGTCTACGVHVAAKTGRIEKIDGKWRTFHLDGECPTGDDLAALVADKVTEPGIYRKDGQFFRVKAGRYDKSTFWAERIYVPEPDELAATGFVKDVIFIKAGRATFLKASDKITLAEARAFGVAVGSCINCGLTLDGEDGKSLTAGYGATCARNLGWAYPTTADMKTIAAGIATWDELLALRS